MKAVAYIRTPKDRRDSHNQHLKILNYVREHNIALDEIVEVDISSQQDEARRRATEMMNMLQRGNMLVVGTDRLEK
jgi:DNA invertase Pin-like site-specific DNA recombinase